MEKLTERLINLNKISKNLLKYGMLIVLIFFIFSSFLLKNATTISELNLAREFVSGNVYAFSEVVIGTIMIDMLIEKNDQ